MGRLPRVRQGSPALPRPSPRACNPRQLNGGLRVNNFFRDLQYGARTLAKTPGFAAIIVLTMALSIGANSAIFSVIHGVLLRPLPCPDAGRIVRVLYRNAEFPKFPMNHFDLRDFRSW